MLHRQLGLLQHSQEIRDRGRHDVDEHGQQQVSSVKQRERQTNPGQRRKLCQVPLHQQLLSPGYGKARAKVPCHEGLDSGLTEVAA